MFWLWLALYFVGFLVCWVLCSFALFEADGSEHAADEWGKGRHSWDDAVSDPAVWIVAAGWPLAIPVMVVAKGVRFVVAKIERRMYETRFTMQEMARRGAAQERLNREGNNPMTISSQAWATMIQNQPPGGKV